MSCTATRYGAIAPKIADMAARRDAAGGAPMQYGMAAYTIVRDSETEAMREFYLLLLQMSPQEEERERLAAQVVRTA